MVSAIRKILPIRGLCTTISLLLLMMAFLSVAHMHQHHAGVLAQQDQIPPRPPVTVSGDIVGKYGGYNGSPSRYIDGSKGKDVIFKEVRQLAKLDDSTILIAEHSSRMVRMYNIAKDEATSLAGKYSVRGTYEGSKPLGEACFNEPLGVTATADGEHVYVSNYFGHFISRVNRNKDTVEIVAGIPDREGGTESEGGPALETALARPRLLSLDHDGRLVIPDERSKSIYRLENNPPHGV